MSNGALTVSSLGGLFQKHSQDIGSIAIDGMDMARFQAGIVQAFRKNPGLLNCTADSIKMAIMDAAAVGIIPNAGERPLGYLIPWGKDCQFSLSVYGRIYLMKRHSNLIALKYSPVFEGDDFKVENNNLGTFWSHTPKAMDRTPEKLTHIWIEGTYRDDKGIERTDFFWITRLDIERIRAKSRQANAGPWKNDYVQMAIAKAINLYSKDKQQSPIMTGAIRREEIRETGGNQWDMDANWEAEEGDAVATPTEEPKAIAPAASPQTVAAMSN